MIRTHRELTQLPTIEERYKYLALRGLPGSETFGYDRYLNQKFYQSKEWRHLRHFVISRDHGCDLGVHGYEIHSGLVVHHMNPIQLGDDFGTHLNPDFLITVSHKTHNAIHYGDASLLPTRPVVRTSGDTKLW
jgi:hypothetical protein